MFEIWSWWCKYLSSFDFVNITFIVSHIFDLGRDKRDTWEQIDYDCEFPVWIRLILTWCRCSIAGLAVSNSPSMCQKQSHERAKRQGILLSIPLKFSWWHVTPETRFGLLARRQFRDYYTFLFVTFFYHPLSPSSPPSFPNPRLFHSAKFSIYVYSSLNFINSFLICAIKKGFIKLR